MGGGMASSGPSCVVATRAHLPGVATQALLSEPNVQAVEVTADDSLASELAASLEANVEALIPYPAHLVSVAVRAGGEEQQAGASQRGRRASSADVVELDITFSEQAPVTLMTATELYPDGDVPQGRYLLRFRIANAASTENAREKALVALNARGIPAVDVQASGDQV